MNRLIQATAVCLVGLAFTIAAPCARAEEAPKRAEARTVGNEFDSGKLPSDHVWKIQNPADNPQPGTSSDLVRVKELPRRGKDKIAARTEDAPKRAEETDGSITVRPLAFKPSEGDFYIRFGGQSKVTAIEDVVAVEKLLGRDSAKQLIDRVDFTKEKVVLVSWTTSGPPEGSLKHEVKGVRKERRLVFYVQGPADAQIRGARARIAADFFAVPKVLAVAFDAAERLYGNDAGSETLAGTKWRLTAWSVSSLDPSGYTITADFSESDISGRSAVNTYGGPYTITGGGAFSVGELHGTRMGGSEDAMRAESQ